MQFSLTPLFVAVFVVGLLVGLVIGALGGVLLWPTPPCPACPVYVEPTPVPCPTPRPVACDCVYPTPVPCETPLPQADESPESAFYRGWLGSCVISGVLSGVPREATVTYCAGLLEYSVNEDFFTVYRPDNWTWPLPELTPPPSKSDAGP